jgi:hypothetical protein
MFSPCIVFGIPFSKSQVTTEAANYILFTLKEKQKYGENLVVYLFGVFLKEQLKHEASRHAMSLSTFYAPDTLSSVTHSSGADPGFQVRGGGAHIKKLRRAEGGANIFEVFRVKNLRAGCAPPPPPPLNPPLQLITLQYSPLITHVSTDRKIFVLLISNLIGSAEFGGLIICTYITFYFTLFG